MAHEIRRAVIRRIAEQKRVSLAVASYIYGCKPIAVKQRLCEAQSKQQWCCTDCDDTFRSANLTRCPMCGGARVIGPVTPADRETRP